jgi:hypothetical protein
MQFRQVFIQEYGNGKLQPEHKDVKESLERRKISFTLFTRKKLERRQLPVDRDCMVVGDHLTIRLALKQLGIEDLAKSCYPASLQPLLKRRIWTSSLREELLKSETGFQSVFVKPKDDLKRFTGFVIQERGDLYKAGGASRSLPVFCSEVVSWRSEFRIFVTNGAIVGMKYYASDGALLPDEGLIKNAIQTLERSGEATKGYGIDFGVLENGETAMVEWNDGYSLGSYGLAGDVYTDLLIARWEELMGND